MLRKHVEPTPVSGGCALKWNPLESLVARLAFHTSLGKGVETANHKVPHLESREWPQGTAQLAENFLILGPKLLHLSTQHGSTQLNCSDSFFPWPKSGAH